MTDAAPDYAVFDCMIFLQAAAKPESASAACVALIERHVYALGMSGAVLDEVRDVLSRSEIRRTFKSLNDEVVTAFVEHILDISRWFNPVPAVFSYARDPDDEPYLNLAIACGARYLVSRDRDLLDLESKDSAAGCSFREFNPSISILDPIEFLSITRESRIHDEPTG